MVSIILYIILYILGSIYNENLEKLSEYRDLQ